MTVRAATDRAASFGGDVQSLPMGDAVLAWEREVGGPLPYPLMALPGEGPEPVDPTGRIPGSALDLLLVLARPDVTIDSVTTGGPAPRSVAAIGSGGGVLAGVSGDRLLLKSIRPTALARELVATLPDGVRGRGSAITVRRSVLLQAAGQQVGQQDDDDDYDPWGLDSRGGPTADLTLLAERAEQRTAGGQFGVSVRDTVGGRTVRSTTLVNWFDTPDGRYLMVCEPDWVSVAPADAELVAARLDEIMNDQVTRVTGRGRR